MLDRKRVLQAPSSGGPGKEREVAGSALERRGYGAGGGGGRAVTRHS